MGRMVRKLIDWLLGGNLERLAEAVAGGWSE